MKKRFVKMLLVLAVVSTLSLSACGSEVLEEIAPSDVVEQVEDVVSEVVEVAEDTIKEELAETEELTETTETEEVAEEETGVTTEEETTEVKEEQSVSEEKPVAEVTQKEEKPKEDKPSTKPNAEKPKEETPKAEEKPVEQKPTQTENPSTTPVQTPSTSSTPVETPVVETPTTSDCPKSSTGHSWYHAEESQTCQHGERTYDICTLCGQIENEVVTKPAAPHHEVLGFFPEADCTSSGWARLYCDICETFLAEGYAVEPYGHDKSENSVTGIQKATCTEEEYTYYTCSRTGCGVSFREKTGEALGHDYIEAELTDGTPVMWCTRCYEYYER